MLTTSQFDSSFKFFGASFPHLLLCIHYNHVCSLWQNTTTTSQGDRKLNVWQRNDRRSLYQSDTHFCDRCLWQLIVGKMSSLEFFLAFFFWHFACLVCTKSVPSFLSLAVWKRPCLYQVGNLPHILSSRHRLSYSQVLRGQSAQQYVKGGQLVQKIITIF